VSASSALPRSMRTPTTPLVWTAAMIVPPVIPQDASPAAYFPIELSTTALINAYQMMGFMTTMPVRLRLPVLSTVSHAMPPARPVSAATVIKLSLPIALALCARCLLGSAVVLALLIHPITPVSTAMAICKTGSALPSRVHLTVFQRCCFLS
jgi:hypothetical protein